MRTKADVITAALNMYYDGLSTWKIQRQIAKIFKVDVTAVAVWKWIMKYSDLVSEYVETLKPQLSGLYHHDETQFKVGGAERYFWQTIDGDTRYLVAHLLSNGRSSEDAKKVFTQALQKQRPPARGLNHDTTAKKWLDGYIVNYNFVKPHISLDGQTPAQAAGLNVKPDWGELIQQATQSMAKKDTTTVKEIVTT